VHTTLSRHRSRHIAGIEIEIGIYTSPDHPRTKKEKKRKERKKERKGRKEKQGRKQGSSSTHTQDA